MATKAEWDDENASSGSSHYCSELIKNETWHMGFCDLKDIGKKRREIYI